MKAHTEGVQFELDGDPYQTAFRLVRLRHTQMEPYGLALGQTKKASLKAGLTNSVRSDAYSAAVISAV